MKRRRAKSKLIPQTSQSMLTLRPPGASPLRRTRENPDASDAIQDEEETEFFPPEQSPKTASFLKKLTADLAFDPSEDGPERPVSSTPSRSFKNSPKTASFLKKLTADSDAINHSEPSRTREAAATNAVLSDDSSESSKKSPKGKSPKTESFLKKWIATPGAALTNPTDAPENKQKIIEDRQSTSIPMNAASSNAVSADSPKKSPKAKSPRSESFWDRREKSVSPSRVSSAAEDRYPEAVAREINAADKSEPENHTDVNEDTIKFIPLKLDSFTTFETLPQNPGKSQTIQESPEQPKKSTGEEAFQETHFEQAYFKEAQSNPDKQTDGRIWGDWEEQKEPEKQKTKAEQFIPTSPEALPKIDLSEPSQEAAKPRVRRKPEKPVLIIKEDSDGDASKLSTPQTPQEWLERARQYHMIADLYQEKGDLSTAVACYRTELEIRKQLEGQVSFAGWEDEMVLCCKSLGMVLQKTGYLEEAADCFSQAVLYQERLTENSNIEQDLRELVVLCTLAGDLSGVNGEMYYEKALEVSRKLKNLTGAVEDYEIFANNCYTLGVPEGDVRLLQDAYTSYEEALRLGSHRGICIERLNELAGILRGMHHRLKETGYFRRQGDQCREAGHLNEARRYYRLALKGSHCEHPERISPWVFEQWMASAYGLATMHPEQPDIRALRQAHQFCGVLSRNYPDVPEYIRNQRLLDKLLRDGLSSTGPMRLHFPDKPGKASSSL